VGPTHDVGVTCLGTKNSDMASELKFLKHATVYSLQHKGLFDWSDSDQAQSAQPEVV
jgi:hypothetical protein